MGCPPFGDLIRPLLRSSLRMQLVLIVIFIYIYNYHNYSQHTTEHRKYRNYGPLIGQKPKSYHGLTPCMVRPPVSTVSQAFLTLTVPVTTHHSSGAV